MLPGWLGLPTEDVDVSPGDIAISVLVFLGIPLSLGYLTRRIGEATRGREWYESRFLPRIGPWALYGLLFTDRRAVRPAGRRHHVRPRWTSPASRVPLLAYFALMWTGSFAARPGRSACGYARTTTLAFTAAGNNFELAIAVAIGVFGVTSGQALAGTVGPLIEVPVLVALVYVSLWARRRFFPPDPVSTPAPAEETP